MTRILFLFVLALSSLYSFGQVQPSVSIAPASQSVCTGLTAYFTATAVGNNTISYNWQYFTGAVYSDLANNTIYSGVKTFQLSIKPTATGTSYYRCRIRDGSSTIDYYSSVSTLTIVSPPSTAPTTTNGYACSSPSSVLLSASGATGTQTYQWYFGGKPINGATAADYVTPALSANTTYYVTIDNGVCESTQVAALAQLLTPPAAPTATNGTGCTSSSVVLNAAGASNGQYRWYTASGKAPLSGETNSSYTTPALTATTTYYVCIYNGFCESSRVAVTATINPPPAAPVAVNNSLCASGRVALGVTGAKDGQYRWYTSSTGGQAIASEVNGRFLTPEITSTTTYYATIYNGLCESARTPVTATIGGTGCNNAPVIQPTPIVTQIEGKVTLDLVALISDKDGNLDLNTLKVVVPPASGASASITTSHALILDYSSTPFSGLEYLTIEVCDLAGACAQKQLSIEVAGDIVIYNAISPGNDGKNDIFLIKYIDILTNTQKNHVYLYSRWGDVIFDMADYNNTTKVFRGLNNSGDEIPSGTYFYKIEFANGQKAKTGYLTLKR
ncbi:MAG: hypothetical protein DI538_03360 [Azospira oryzae]|nr:MAG: hypothetical protein DI538_03360 [Azospira oryzae]